MSIDKEGSMFVLRCDICGEKADQDFDIFIEAVQYAQAERWLQKRGGEWEDICPECQEG